MSFNSDRDGFLLPDTRLDGDALVQGIRGVERNTDLILSLLRARTRTLDRSRVANPNSRTQRPGGAPGGLPGPAPMPRPTSDRTSSPMPRSGRTGSAGGTVRERDSRGRFVRDPGAQVAGEVRQLTRQQAQQNAERERAEQAERARAGRDQPRGADGRFGSGGGSGEDENKGTLGRIKDFFKERSGGPSIDGAEKVDPVIESAKEVAGMMGGAVGALKATGELGRAVIGRGFGGKKAESDGQTPWFKRLLQQLKLMRRDDSQFHRAELRALNEPRTGGGGGSIITDLLKLIFSPIGAAIVAALTGVWMGFGDKIVGAWTGMVDWIRTKWDAAVSGFMRIWEPIAKFFGDKFGVVANVAKDAGNAVNSAVKGATGIDMKAGVQKAANAVSDAGKWAGGGIRRLLGVKGKDRDYERQDGTVEQRRDGSVSWRNNNPGNMKFGYKGSADKTDKSSRSKEKALADARKQYGDDVVDLDQFGNAIFSTPEAGRAAQAKLLTRRHGNKTVEEMLPKYAVDDYSGKANHANYAAGIHKTAEAKGLSLRGKKISDLTPAEMSALQDGMQKVEGFKEGKTTIIPAQAKAAPVQPGAPLVLGADKVPSAGPAVPALTPTSVPTATATAAGAMPPPGATGPGRVPSITVPAQTPPAPTPRADTPIPLGSKGPLEVTVRGQNKPAGQDLNDRRLAHIATGGMSSG